MKTRLILILLNVFVATSLFGQNLMSDKDALKDMLNMYQERKELLGERHPELFKKTDSIKSPELLEATRFLIAYAPLSDIANLSPDYFREMADLALKTKHEFEWGKKIPSEIFMHFVLPYRVNNENPDKARSVFFLELKNRLKGLSMYDAALEVNHWCHEKVIYRATDERTSAPLSTIKTAFGRCGEESTFTVSALRSAGIPARQVYTPRWAHTDDNHAWVEAWVDGKWYYLGACEPEPELNMGWFSAPVTRAMMTHTNTYGKYFGPEKTLVKNKLFSKLNLLSNYAPSRKVILKITDNAKQPIAGLQVRFSLYNYSEFYDLAALETDKNGNVALETGFGELLIWMTDGKQFDWHKLLANEADDTVAIVFNDKYKTIEQYSKNNTHKIDMDFMPPFEGEFITPSTDKAELNQTRLKEEDVIRQKYEATFPDSSFLTNKYSADAFSKEMVDLVLKSRGNYSEIMNFYDNAKNKKDAIALLSVISEKDLRDTPSEVLFDHFNNVNNFKTSVSRDVFVNYILNPRIGRELLSPWRSEIQKAFSKKQIKSFIKNPENLKIWVKNNVTIDDENNYYRVTLFPNSVQKLKIADEYSRNVFFIACCRSFGIPARLEPATYLPEYFFKNEWVKAFPKAANIESGKGKLVLQNKNEFAPMYYVHYTIALLQDGVFKTLDYESDESIRTFPCSLNLAEGVYRLMTGNRLQDGSVLTRWTFFEITKNNIVEQEITFNDHEQKPEPLKNIKNDISICNGADDNLKNLISLGGSILAMINPATEPGRHFLAELQPFSNEFNKWGGNIILVLPESISEKVEFNNLPKNTILLKDCKAKLHKELLNSFGEKYLMPLVLFIDKNGDVFYYSSGYQVNTAQMLLKIIKRLQN